MAFHLHLRAGNCWQFRSEPGLSQLNKVDAFLHNSLAIQSPARHTMVSEAKQNKCRNDWQRCCCFAPSTLDALSLAAARRLARSRCAPIPSDGDSQIDRFAEALAVEDNGLPSPACTDAAVDARVTAFLDQQLLRAAHSVNPERQREYNQVVLISPGMDTRAYRLLWPAGIVIYEVATAEAHSVAAVTLKAEGAVVPRGCLLRRVAWDFQDADTLQDGLMRAGFRGDRLSIWGIQGLLHLGFGIEELRSILLAVVNMAAYDSLVMGELCCLDQAAAENLIANFNLLGRIEPLPSKSKGSALRWLFSSHHKQLSTIEANTYNSHVTAAEDADEDFFGNFS